MLNKAKSLTRSSCCLSVEERLATLYRSTRSPSIPSPSTGRWVAMAARAWHIRTREESQDKCSWPSRKSTADWLRCGRLFSSFTNEVRAVYGATQDSRKTEVRFSCKICSSIVLLNPNSFICVVTVSHLSGLTLSVAWAPGPLSWLQSISRDSTARTISCSSCATSL